MTKITLSLTMFAAFVTLNLQIAPVHAQLARTYVSSVNGNDANDCNRLTPCRTFQRAHNQTLALGEITVLDPGGYGAVNITKGISIINDGVGEAGVLVSGGANGITVNAGDSDAVSLRGLTVKGIGFGGGNGIVFTRGKSLTIENCAIRNMTGLSTLGHGIIFNSHVSNCSTKLHFAVSNTVVADNQGHGIAIVPFGCGIVLAEITRSEVYASGGHGIVADVESSFGGRIVAAVESTVSAGNVFAGFAASLSGGSGNTALSIIRSVSANNGIGLSSTTDFRTHVYVGSSMLFANDHTWPSGQIIHSLQDNNVVHNFDGDPAPPFTLQKK